MGNYSILLTNLTPKHDGLFSCVVFSHNKTNETDIEIQEFGEYMRGLNIFCSYGYVFQKLFKPVGNKYDIN